MVCDDTNQGEKVTPWIQTELKPFCENGKIIKDEVQG
jgi:hypothetical protein